MVQFTKLRLNGFKSFVDRTEIEIGEGLTGIVGPNGCGKSNLTEALRWVMGENSPKRMRGGGMEDVIFNGTAKRASRNFAEVTVHLDNSDKTAPSQFSQFEEIEVIRRIDKDQGSTYRINGKVVRARDVQMLFADMVVGANSPALVSQGRVTEMINAKPLERRKILEESAGISGLYARRHEAEIRLKAASTNLARIQDSIGGLETQYNSLKRQARQAQRYKSLNQEIAQLERLLASIEWLQAETACEQAQAYVKQAEGSVAEKMTVIAQLNKTLETQLKDIPSVRESATEATTIWQTQNITLQRLEEEEKRLEQVLSDLKTQIEGLVEDQKHEKANLIENTSVIEKLESEEKILRRSNENQDAKIKELQKNLVTQKKQVDELDATYSASMKTYAENKARVDSATSAIEKLKYALSSLTEKKKSLFIQKDTFDSQSPSKEKGYALEKEITKLEGEIAALREKRADAENELENQQEAIASLRKELSEAESKQATCTAKISTLQSILETDSETQEQPVLSMLNPKKGSENALSRALGEAITASLDNSAKKKWTKTPLNLKNAPRFANDIKTLADYVEAPDMLHLALQMVAYVEDNHTFETVSSHLQFGQSVVSADGRYQRWDGYTIDSEAPDLQASLLKQKNELKDLIAQRPSLDKKVQALTSKIENKETDISSAKEKISELKQLFSEKEARVSNARRDLKLFSTELDKQTEERIRLEESLSNVKTQIETIEAELEAEQESLKISKAALESQTDDEALQEKKKKLDEAQTSYHSARAELDRVESDNKRRQMRLHAITDERVNLQNRVIRAKDQLEKLAEREVSARSKLKENEGRPTEIRVEITGILDGIGALERRKQELQDKLAKLEQEVTDTRQALKDKETQYQDAREARGRAMATLEATNQSKAHMQQSIEGRFECDPAELMASEAEALAKCKDTENGQIKTGSAEDLKNRKERLVRDREAIGAVNLRAESEAAEIEKQLGSILAEQNDLSQAISELETAIQKLNDEARTRLTAAFKIIDGYFQKLFSRLFNGGKAHLEMIESDDILEAGLEIYAQPPGKSLQSLSLLSGGEQTLTSIALIFAMFLTTPSPICVLDEIDAPLDDANVDRVCTLLEEMVANGSTRFLVITHHRMTMARMDRLYGVTMAEQGVSQLVSVDLQQKLDFLDVAE